MSTACRPGYPKTLVEQTPKNKNKQTKRARKVSGKIQERTKKFQRVRASWFQIRSTAYGDSAFVTAREENSWILTVYKIKKQNNKTMKSPCQVRRLSTTWEKPSSPNTTVLPMSSLFPKKVTFRDHTKAWHSGWWDRHLPLYPLISALGDPQAYIASLRAHKL